MADDKRKDPAETPDADSASDAAAPAAEVDTTESDGTERGGTAVRTRATMPKRRADGDSDTDTTDTDTKKRDKSKGKKAGEKRHRTTPAEFVRQCIDELRRVVWPSVNQWQQYFVVVLIFVLFMLAFASLLDLGYGTALLRLFG